MTTTVAGTDWWTTSAGCEDTLVERLRGDIRRARVVPIPRGHLCTKGQVSLVAVHPARPAKAATSALPVKLVLGLALARRAKPRIPAATLLRLGQVNVRVGHEKDVVPVCRWALAQQPTFEKGEVAQIGFPEVIDDVADERDHAYGDVDDDVDDLV